jgi:glycerophosphoryl diester phosphodiesterase
VRSASGALEQEIAAFLRAGVDGVFSDNPDIAVNARRQMTEAPRERK